MPGLGESETVQNSYPGLSQDSSREAEGVLLFSYRTRSPNWFRRGVHYYLGSLGNTAAVCACTPCTRGEASGWNPGALVAWPDLTWLLLMSPSLPFHPVAPLPSPSPSEHPRAFLPLHRSTPASQRTVRLDVHPRALAVPLVVFHHSRLSHRLPCFAALRLRRPPPTPPRRLPPSPPPLRSGSRSRPRQRTRPSSSSSASAPTLTPTLGLGPTGPSLEPPLCLDRPRRPPGIPGPQARSHEHSRLLQGRVTSFCWPKPVPCTAPTFDDKALAGPCNIQSSY